MPKRLLGCLSNWTMWNLMAVLTRDRAARPSLLVLSSLLHDRRPSPHILTPFTAEVLTRVMRLGLESDSSHYFCDLWLNLDLQRNGLRLDLDLQGNDLLPTQVKSYSSDPGTSYIFKIALGQKKVCFRFTPLPRKTRQNLPYLKRNLRYEVFPFFSPSFFSLFAIIFFYFLLYSPSYDGSRRNQW